MDAEEGKDLTRRCMDVILSCKTEAQLINAETYSMLAHLKMAREKAGLVKETDFVRLIQRAIGYSLCKMTSPTH